MNNHQNHIKRIKGQITGIEKMIDKKKDCTEIIIQIQAARASLASLGQGIVADEAECCLTIEDQKERESSLRKLVKNFFKLS